jgi:xanthine dehydrogenase accessory factor
LRPHDIFLTLLAAQPACLVSVHAARGSVPRGRGAWMAVFADAAVGTGDTMAGNVGGIIGTIGGGQLEFQAIGEARRLLHQNYRGPKNNPHEELPGLPLTASPPPVLRYPLGPSLGQCCGGEVHLRYELVNGADGPALAARLTPTLAPLALFGGGHVGKALVQVLGNLPLQVTWIDSRDEIFPIAVPDNVACEHSDPVYAAVAQLASKSMVIIMSFSHAEDLDVVAACLQRQRVRGDLPFVGLIGSKTKWATFRHRLAERGFTDAELARVRCPIGMPGITGKEPQVIAVSVAAQILQELPQGDANVYTLA